MSEASSILGRRVKYTLEGEEIDGIVVAMKRTGTIIEDTETGQQWPGVKFQLRTIDGRKVWTVTYPDKRP